MNALFNLQKKINKLLIGGIHKVPVQRTWWSVIQKNSLFDLHLPLCYILMGLSETQELQLEIAEHIQVYRLLKS